MTQGMHSHEDNPIWWSAHAVPEVQPLEANRTADIVVVGGGLAGLAIAYFVIESRPDLSVIVLEAEQIGAGATGRSTGVASPGVSMPLATLRRRYGDRAAARAYNASISGISRLRELIVAEGIECDAVNGPHTTTAFSTRAQRRMSAHLRHLSELGCETPRWHDTEELIHAAGQGYRCGFSYPDALLLDPYRLLTGLAEVLTRRGAAVYENSRVQSVTSNSARPAVYTRDGRIQAQMVVLATDGYSGALNPLQSSVVPVRTHLLATRPLEPAELAGLGWGGQGMVYDQRNFFNYYRMTADKRILFGGGRVTIPTRHPQTDAAASRAIQLRVERELKVRFPSLQDVTIDARWSGLTASTYDRLPVVGPVKGRNGVYFAGGWGGHGFSLCTDVAWRFGRMLAADPAPLDLPWYRNSAHGIPTSVLRNVGVRAYLRALDVSDHLGKALNSVSPSAVPTNSGSFDIDRRRSSPSLESGLRYPADADAQQRAAVGGVDRRSR